VWVVDVGATRIGDAQVSLMYASGRLSSQYEAEDGRRKQERRRKRASTKALLLLCCREGDNACSLLLSASSLEGIDLSQAANLFSTTSLFSPASTHRQDATHQPLCWLACYNALSLPY
jgi:hypothetical protein